MKAVGKVGESGLSWCRNFTSIRHTSAVETTTKTGKVETIGSLHYL